MNYSWPWAEWLRSLSLRKYWDIGVDCYLVQAFLEDQSLHRSFCPVSSRGYPSDGSNKINYPASTIIGIKCGDSFVAFISSSGFGSTYPKYYRAISSAIDLGALHQLGQRFSLLTLWFHRRLRSCTPTGYAAHTVFLSSSSSQGIPRSLWCSPHLSAIQLCMKPAGISGFFWQQEGLGPRMP